MRLGCTSTGSCLYINAPAPEHVGSNYGCRASVTDFNVLCVLALRTGWGLQAACDIVGCRTHCGGENRASATAITGERAHTPIVKLVPNAQRSVNETSAQAEHLEGMHASDT